MAAGTFQIVYHAEAARAVNFNPAGQIIGRLSTVRPVRQVIYDLVNEYFEATERLAALSGQNA